MPQDLNPEPPADSRPKPQLLPGVAMIFGLLRLTKWGWALVTAGCVLLATGDLVYFARTHVDFFLVRGLLTLIFFLYLVRPETRDHLR
ncbi:MAG: hypothetical protein NVSMB62_30020 [Acidobacteriaceae bacterium]